MGLYLNPSKESKESFLAGYVEQEKPSYDDVPRGLHAVCLVNNGAFTAAAIAIDAQEFSVFAAETRRDTKWYYVPTRELVEADASLEYLLLSST